MRRRTSTREILLLLVLLLLALSGGYYLLWYMPMTQERDSCRAQTEALEAEILAAQAKAAELARMKAELEAIFAANAVPKSIALYDNLKPIMRELNDIFRQTKDFSVSFGTAEENGENGGIMRRTLTVSFSCESYAEAREVLQKLHDSAYRCILDSVSMSLPGSTDPKKKQPEISLSMAERYDAPVSVSATLVYFEYREGKN